jgi:hypothetical protein
LISIRVQADFERVLTISKGIKPYIQGDFGKAYAQLQQLPDFKISDEKVGNTEGVAALALPKSVVLFPDAEEDIPIDNPIFWWSALGNFFTFEWQSIINLL